jgi:gluconolactonase
MTVLATRPTVEVRSLTKVADTDAHEGPVYHPMEHALYFTTSRPDVAIRRLLLDGTGRIQSIRSETATANGMALDAAGRLIVCEQGTRWDPAAISRVDPHSGRRVTLLESWLGQPLNSPNDVVVRRDGTIWFSDPSYGHLQGFRPAPRAGDQVYRFDPATGAVAVVADRFDKPNGLVFSPREDVLYVADSGAPRHVKAFDVIEGRRLANERVLARIGRGEPDGLKVDAEGRVYVSCADGVAIFAPDGALVGEIDLPGAVNFAFGGPRRDVLYVTADDAIWAAQLTTTGPPGHKGGPQWT